MSFLLLIGKTVNSNKYTRDTMNKTVNINKYKYDAMNKTVNSNKYKNDTINDTSGLSIRLCKFMLCCCFKNII